MATTSTKGTQTISTKVAFTVVNSIGENDSAKENRYFGIKKLLFGQSM